jgi:hypothetical protein
MGQRLGEVSRSLPTLHSLVSIPSSVTSLSNEGLSYCTAQVGSATLF